jgi:hypothetical protein
MATPAPLPEPFASFRAFVEGELPADAFEQRLYHDPQFESALSSAPAPHRCDPSAETLYMFLIALDYRSAQDMRKARRALAPLACGPEKDFSQNALWQSDFTVPNPRVTEKLVARVEALLKVKLPSAYLALMREQNGGCLKLNKVPYLEPPPESVEGYTGGESASLDCIYGLHYDTDADGSIAQTLTLGAEWGVPPELILLDGDGHWWVALDYRVSKDNPPVVYYVSDTGEHATLAHDFGSFLKRMIMLPDDYYDNE